MLKYHRDLRNSIDTLRLETDKQATSHLELAAKLKADMEVPTAAFVAKQVNFKKTFVANIERMFKNKQNQESHVAKAKEKYELECSRINAHTAHSSYIQGKELDKVQLKLEKAQAAVKTSEKEYANFVRVLKDTYGKWEKEWKEFCDRCQDIEEERIEFMKDNLWSYANAISTVCVADDEVSSLYSQMIFSDPSLVLRTYPRCSGATRDGTRYGEFCA